jgi:hypothetical protein
LKEAIMIYSKVGLSLDSQSLGWDSNPRLTEALTIHVTEKLY